MFRTILSLISLKKKKCYPSLYGNKTNFKCKLQVVVVKNTNVILCDNVCQVPFVRNYMRLTKYTSTIEAANATILETFCYLMCN